MLSGKTHKSVVCLAPHNDKCKYCGTGHAPWQCPAYGIHVWRVQQGQPFQDSLQVILDMTGELMSWGDK